MPFKYLICEGKLSWLVRVFHCGITLGVVGSFLYTDSILQKILHNKTDLPYGFAFLIIHVISLILYITVSFMNPGYANIKSYSNPYDDGRSSSSDEIELGNNDMSPMIKKTSRNNFQTEDNLKSINRYCTICRIEQPLRCRHCNDCNKCVLKYDHHCPWIDNCIGENNHPVFLVFLLFELISIIWTFYWSGISICSATEWFRWLRINVFFLINILICVLSGIPLICLLIFHLYLVFTNSTTWETAARDKITYLKKLSFHVNPFHQRPLILQGHERPITQVKYNREGDLLFTIAKEKEPNVWYTVNGERLGTYDGHKGAVWCLDVDWETRFLITGAADDSLNIWDIETGTLLNSIRTLTSVRSCQFGYSGNTILMTTDNIKNQKCEMMVFDIRDKKQIAESSPMWRVDCPVDFKITNCIWGPVDSVIYTGHDNGQLCRFNMKTMSFDEKINAHTASITDMQASRDNTMFITSSKDQTAKLFNAYDMEMVKKYTADRPLNSAAISPDREHILLGGGQEAAEVTKTAASKGKFEALFYHMIFENEITSVKGHFGPINSVAFNPTGAGYASGGEEGLVRMYQFDKDYFEFEIEY